ncbi:MAG: hypothetical protein H0W42_06930 [Gemmatimonadaceae bacterium]|nr:hypothetical protein [Gemmatimonadaceae bacterium]
MLRMLSMRDLRNTPGRFWKTLKGDRMIALSVNGVPKAVVVSVPDGDLEAAVRLVTRVRAQEATDAAERIGAEPGTEGMTLDETGAEISAARRLDEFERVKAIVSSYRLVDTPAIVAAREYGYDIGLLKHSVAEASRYQLPNAQPAYAGRGSTYVREARDVPGDRRIAPEAVTMLRQLATYEVRFVVIGGVAAQLHGSARITKDLDILYDTAPDNIERLAALLIRWRSYLRVDPGLPFTPDARTIKSIEVLTLETEHGKFDVLQRVAGVGTYADALAAMRPFPVADFAVNALSLESLIKSKLAAGRPRDKTEVLELEALRTIAEQQRAALEDGG